MKFFAIFLLIFVKICDSNDFQCVHLNDTVKSIEFYCEHFNGILPINCTTTLLYSIGHYDKSKVKHLKIGGCDSEKIAQIVRDFRNIHSLDISCSNLKSLKPFNITLEHLRQLNASHNHLIGNPSEIWARMPRLVEVDFSHNDLTSAWASSKSLIKIDFSYNNISCLCSSHDLENIPSVEYLNLSHNKIENIDYGNIFSRAKKLKLLQFVDNQYRKFDKEFVPLVRRGVAVHFSWKLVTHVRINEKLNKPVRVVLNSEIEGFWPSFDGKHIEFHCNEESFDNIRKFEFTNNHIENPGEMLRCLTSSLEHLTLIGNFTEKLSSKLLEPFTNLWELTINGAQSMEFDFDSIKKPQHLYTLDISGNNLREIGNVSLLATFPTIFYFNVADNQLENAPELIHYFRTKMSKLNLTGNHVGKLNVTTFQNLDLYELYLRNTNLSFDDLGPFEPLRSLIRFDISDNNLESANFSVPSTVLKYLFHFSASHCNIKNGSELVKQLGPNIHQLNLSGNNLNGLNVNAFENQTVLQYLNLSHTNLTDISINNQRQLNTLDLSFNNLQNVNLFPVSTTIKELYLDGNELTEIPNFTQSTFPNLSALSIAKNQIPCASLAQLNRNWPNLKFVNNPFEQKHGDCSNVVRLIKNLGFVGTYISDWL